MIKCYIASPYSVGDPVENTYRQIECTSKLLDLGFAVYWPLCSHYVHMYFPKDYDVWMNHDLEWLPACDCLLRLDGESKGADIEVQKAKELGIKVFYDIESLVNWRDENGL